MRKKYLCMFSFFFVFAGTFFNSLFVDAAGTYTDVKEDTWYYEYVEDVSEKGLITGYENGKFGAADNLTRGQFATIFYRMENCPDVVFDKAFPDVKDGMFYSIPAEWAYSQELITGYQNGCFGPSDNLTREQLATIMYRYAKQKGEDVSISGDLSKFPDGGKVSDFAKDALSWAVGKGIINGNDNGTLAPQGVVSRATVATIISRYTNSVEAPEKEETDSVILESFDKSNVEQKEYNCEKHPVVHEHVWEEQLKTINYDAVFKQVQACDSCDAFDPNEEHFTKHINAGEAAGTHSVSIEVLPAGSIEVVFGYKCSCGAVLEEEHEHVWKEHYETLEYNAVTKRVQVCKTCKDIYNPSTAHQSTHLLAYEPSGTYGETIEVVPAGSIDIFTGYECSCGATKSFE